MATNWAQLATQSTNSVPPKSDQGALTNTIEKMGAYNLPVIGGIARSITQPFNRILETGAEDVSALAHKLSGDKTPYQTQFISPQESSTLTSPEALKNPWGTAAKDELGQLPSQAGALLGAEGLMGVPGAVKSLPAIVKGAPNAFKMLTPNGAGRAVQKAHEAATATGVTDSVPDVLTEIRQAVEDQLAPRGIGADPTLQNVYGNVIKNITGRTETAKVLSKIDPTSITGEFTPSDLVSARQTLVKRFGYNPENGNLEQKVANIARDVLSRRAKDIAPGLSQADNAYGRSLAIQENAKKLLPMVLRMVGLGGGAAAMGALGKSILDRGPSGDFSP